MHTLIAAVAFTLLLFALPRSVGAQDWSWRARLAMEAHSARLNAAGPALTPTPAGSTRWDGSSLFVAAADSTWDDGGRFRIAGGLLMSGHSTARVRLTAREAYARVTATPWLDLEAGKRLVRWGVGYGFSPTGVLDPPKGATDPSDRLGRNEGMPIVRADVLFGSDASLTIAAASPTLWRDDVVRGTPSRMLAARLRTMVPGGVEVALIGSAAPDRRAAFGASVTHVAGQRLEWHAEVLAGEPNPPMPATGSGDMELRSTARVITAAAGFQYTRSGLNLVMEYHRRTARDPGTPVGNVLFARLARARADAVLAPELIVIRGIDDRSWTTVAGLAWTVRQRLDLTARATRLAGARRSLAARAPVSATLSLGATVRF